MTTGVRIIRSPNLISVGLGLRVKSDRTSNQVLVPAVPQVDRPDPGGHGSKSLSWGLGWAWLVIRAIAFIASVVLC